MSDESDQIEATQDTIACWRINYGLKDSTPKAAADWWRAANGNREPAAPAGAVAALGIALDALELERARAELAEAERDEAREAAHVAALSIDSLGAAVTKALRERDEARQSIALREREISVLTEAVRLRTVERDEERAERDDLKLALQHERTDAENAHQWFLSASADLRACAEAMQRAMVHLRYVRYASVGNRDADSAYALLGVALARPGVSEAMKGGGRG